MRDETFGECDLSAHYDESDVSDLLPDRSGQDLPPQVEYFMSLCETAVASYRYGEQHCDEPVFHFTEGVIDYAWEDPEEMVEPQFGMLFDRQLQPEQVGSWPSRQEIAYQKGAIIGYRLAQEYELRSSQNV